MVEIFDAALVYSPNEWIESFHRHCTNTGSIRIRSLVYDISAVLEENVDTCIISDTHPALCLSLVQSLHEHDIFVIGITDELDAKNTFLSKIGVDAIFSSHKSSSELSQEIIQLLTKSLPSESKAVKHDFIETQNEILHITQGSITCILGTGGSGSSEIAIHVASQLNDSILLDLDFEHPSIAMRLNADIEPHIIDAIESAQNDPDNFLSTVQSESEVDLISGTSHYSYAQDIRDYEITSLLELALKNYRDIVCDIGRVSFDHTFRLNTFKALEKSTTIIIVGDATPLGVVRLLEVLSQLNEKNLISKSRKIHIVLNRATKKNDLNKQLIDEINEIDMVDCVFLINHNNSFSNLTWKGQLNKSKSFSNSISLICDELNDSGVDYRDQQVSA